MAWFPRVLNQKERRHPVSACLREICVNYHFRPGTSGKSCTNQIAMAFPTRAPKMAPTYPAASALAPWPRRRTRWTPLPGAWPATCPHSRQLAVASLCRRRASVARRRYHGCHRLMSTNFAIVMAFTHLLQCIQTTSGAIFFSNKPDFQTNYPGQSSTCATIMRSLGVHVPRSLSGATRRLW